jgi:hypothetical protein
MEKIAYPTEWKVSRNVDFYQIWCQTRELQKGEPMNSAVRQSCGYFSTREEAQECADEMNKEKK